MSSSIDLHTIVGLYLMVKNRIQWVGGWAEEDGWGQGSSGKSRSASTVRNERWWAWSCYSARHIYLEEKKHFMFSVTLQSHEWANDIAAFWPNTSVLLLQKTLVLCPVDQMLNYIIIMSLPDSLTTFTGKPDRLLSWFLNQMSHWVLNVPGAVLLIVRFLLSWADHLLAQDVRAGTWQWHQNSHMSS